MKIVKPAQFKEAAAKLGGRSPVGSKLTSEEWARVPLALRERAFFSATIENAQFLQRSKQLLGDTLTSARETLTLPDGTTTTALKVGGRAKFVEEARRFAIAEGMGPLDPKDIGSIKDIRSESRLNLIYDVQTSAAYEFGGWKQGLDPDVLDEFPAQRFIRESEVKEPRDLHQLHEGEVHIKSDIDFWTGINRDFGVPWGPWGWGCGHGVEDVDRGEAEALGLIAPGQAVAAPEAEFNARLQASTRGLAPDLIEWLSAQFLDQVTVDRGADVVRWNVKPVGPKPKAETQPPESSDGKQVPEAAPATLPPNLSRLRDEIDKAKWHASVVNALAQTPPGADPFLKDLTIRKGKAGSYSPETATITMGSDPDAWSGRPRTLHHEVGHHLHYKTGTITDKGPSPEWAAAEKLDLAGFEAWADARHPGVGMRFYDRSRTQDVAMLDDTAKLYGAKDYASADLDVRKSASAFLDTVMGLSRGAHGDGHSVKYMQKYGAMEVFAHAYASLGLKDDAFQGVFSKVVAEVKRVLKVTS